MRALIVTAFLAGCGGGEAPEGDEAKEQVHEAKEGPAHEAKEVGADGPEDIQVPAIAEIPTDPESIAKGEQIFTARGCPACHQFGSKLVGPDLVGVTQRRSIVWMEKMILHPDEMLAKDPTAKQLLGVHMTPMPKQGVTDEEIGPLLAYIKSKGG
jgi:cytochrome c